MKQIDLEKPNIRIVKNFINKQEIDKILEAKNFSEDLWGLDFKVNYPKEEETDPVLWPSIKQWDGMCVNFTHDRFYERYPIDKSFYKDLENRTKLITEDKFKAKVKTEQYLVNRWRVGRDQAPHLDYFISDEGHHDYDMLSNNNISKKYLESFEGRFQTKHFSSLIYLNNDYDGGEIWFPQYNGFSIKPEPGMLVTFKGDEKTLHGVKMVTSGTRYTVSIFWTDLSKVKDML
jgi:hypothetical protein